MSQSATRPSHRLRHWTALALLGWATLLSTACGDDEPETTSAAQTTPGAVLWDHEWSYVGTFVQTKDSERLPFPTDFSIISAIRYPDGAPPVGDALEGAKVVFELDGRVLMQPDGYSEPAYFYTNYSVVDDSTLRASVRKSIWFKYTYDYDETSHTLLIRPEEEAGSAVMGLFLDLMQATLLSGALDDAAAKITEVLFNDPRVSEAIDTFLFELISGKLDQVPVQDPADVTAWLMTLLRDAGLVPPAMSDTALERIIAPIVEEWLPVDRDQLAEALVRLIRESDLVTGAITPERVDNVLTFLLYRRTLETGQSLYAIDHFEMELKAAN